MQKAPAGCRIDRYTTLRGTSKRKNKISTTYKAAFLTPTLEKRFNLGNTGQRKILCGKAGNHKCLSHYRRRYFYLRPGSRVFCPCKAAWRASDTLIPDRERHGRYTPVREPYGYEPQLQRGRQPSCTEK